MNRLTVEYAKKELEKISSEKSEQHFVNLFAHGSLEVEYYSPQGKDLQQPHDRDEIYVIVSGSGVFFNNGKRQAFSSGEVLFVAAGIEHRFEEFTEDFATWVFFYGPMGGESKGEESDGDEFKGGESKG